MMTKEKKTDDKLLRKNLSVVLILKEERIKKLENQLPVLWKKYGDGEGEYVDFLQLHTEKEEELAELKRELTTLQGIWVNGLVGGL